MGLGAAAKRKKEFLERHPRCCFCEGAGNTTTIDHVPNRACFPGRVSPEGYEFPACDDCQTRSRLDEQAFSFLVVATDQHDEFSEKEVQKAIDGFTNNLTTKSYPNPFVEATMKRRQLARLGIPKPLDMPNADIPLVSLPAEFQTKITRYSAKIIAALFYAEKNRPIPHDYAAIVVWDQFGTPKGRQTMDAFQRNCSQIKLGLRRNIKTGHQLEYASAVSDDADALIASITIGKSLFVGGMIAQESYIRSISNPDKWKSIGHIMKTE